MNDFLVNYMANRPTPKDEKEMKEPLLKHDYLNGVQCKKIINSGELLQLSAMFALKKLNDNKHKVSPFALETLTLGVQCNDEIKEFNEAFYDFITEPTNANKLALLHEIGDCINQLSFIAAKVCGADKLER